MTARIPLRWRILPGEPFVYGVHFGLVGLLEGEQWRMPDPGRDQLDKRPVGYPQHHPALTVPFPTVHYRQSYVAGVEPGGRVQIVDLERDPQRAGHAGTASSDSRIRP